jgi:tripartite-type tricarboxylate transporter receptor subunit TctC
MKLLRRDFLKLAGSVIATPALPHLAFALDYPTRPTRIIAGFAAGGGVDITARLIGQWLADHLGQPFVVENRTGAGGNIGTEAVVNAAPDGYTLLLATVPNAVNASLYHNLKFNFVRDIAPVAGVIRVPMVVLVHPSVPVQTIAEFIPYAKANPGKVNMASAGSGSAPHMAGELFKMMTGVHMEHIPYRGAAPATTDLLGGRLQVLFDTLPAAIGNIRMGKVRALAVTSKKRSESLPEVPAMNEFLPGYEADSFHGISAPSGTPRDIVEKLNREINAVLADPKVKARLAELGAEVFTGTPEDYGRYLAGEIARWAKVIEFSGAKAE